MSRPGNSKAKKDGYTSVTVWIPKDKKKALELKKAIEGGTMQDFMEEAILKIPTPEVKDYE